jgi:dTDP-4-dehydrorhamnose 3,5-epimerase
VKVSATALPHVLLIEPAVHEDARGFFFECWHAGRYAAAGIEGRFVQDNYSHSVRGTLRGLHYQLQHPQGKLVQVLRGEIFDVAVDLRQSSPTCARWTAEVLSDLNRRQLWVPPGFAHGFYVLSESADVIYKCTEFYVPEDEQVLRWNDPELAIAWPLADGVRPLLSARDAAATSLGEASIYR